MPRAAKKRNEIDPAAVYVCWQSGSALVDGEDVNFQRGQRLRGDSPTVQALPHLFVADGDPVPSHWDAIVERNEAAQAPPTTRSSCPARCRSRLSART